MTLLAKILKENMLNLEDLSPNILKAINLLEQTKLNYLELETHIKEKTFLFESKFGGKPYWPKSLSSPKNNDGKELTFLAQINLSETPHLSYLPGSGILQFFVLGNAWDVIDEKNNFLNKNRSIQVIYHQHIEVESLLLSNDIKNNLKTKDFPFLKEYSLKFINQIDYMNSDDYHFTKIIDKINFSDDELYFLYDLYILSGNHKIGGYPNFDQDDPRENIKGNYILLFQMRSDHDDDHEILFGDDGLCNFFIKKEDLLNLNFNDILFEINCS